LAEIEASRWPILIGTKEDFSPSKGIPRGMITAKKATMSGVHSQGHRFQDQHDVLMKKGKEARCWVFSFCVSFITLAFFLQTESLWTTPPVPSHLIHQIMRDARPRGLSLRQQQTNKQSIDAWFESASS